MARVKPHPIRNGGMPRYTEGSPEPELKFEEPPIRNGLTIMGTDIRALMDSMGITGHLDAAELPLCNDIALRYTLRGRSTTRTIDMDLLASHMDTDLALRTLLTDMHDAVSGPPLWEYHQPNQRPNVREEALQEYLVSVGVANAEGRAPNGDALDALRYFGVAAGIYQEQMRASRRSGEVPWAPPLESTHKPFRFSKHEGFAPSEVLIDECAWVTDKQPEPEPDGPIEWVCRACGTAVSSDSEPDRCMNPLCADPEKGHYIK